MICEWRFLTCAVGVSRTALSVHFNKECSYRHFAGWNSQVEEKDCDPCEEKKVVKLSDFRNDCDMVS